MNKIPTHCMPERIKAYCFNFDRKTSNCDISTKQLSARRYFYFEFISRGHKITQRDHSKIAKKIIKFRVPTNNIETSAFRQLIY